MSQAALPDPVSATQKEITIASTPGAKCTLTSANASKPLTAWADDVGIVHLWAAQKSISEVHTLTCNEAGAAAQYAFDLSDVKTFSPATPRTLPTRRTIRPAMVNPTTITDAEVARAGLPPRPDFTRAPSLYKKWLDLVSSPSTVMPADRVQLAEQGGPENDATDTLYDGLVLGQSGVTYTIVVGTFYVPYFRATPPSNNQAFWVGLDGLGTPDLIQDGIWYDSNGSVGEYQAWYEYVPDNKVLNMNMVVTPGHQMQFWAWEADSSCGYTHGGGYACFFYEDLTTGDSLSSGAYPAPNSEFRASSADAILENRGEALAIWESASMQLDSADPSWNGHNFASDWFKNFTLLSNMQTGNTLATASYSSAPDGASYFWQNTD